MHLPIWQVSVWVQASPSLQAVPSCTIVPWHEPFMQASLAVHSFPSSQLVPSGDGAPMQTPAWQVSVCVQLLPSSQDVASGTALLPLQAPAWPVSVGVRVSPASQAVPSGFAGFEHWPLAGSQAPAVWHWSWAVQTTGLVPVQPPPWQVSVWVQASPSLQAAPSGFAGFEQTPVAGSHVPALWH